ncbi:MAG: DsbA family protein [Zetaproteobacteria bacterium]|nr:DsbA family protein [Zetaproteobacteria bacterium]
MRILSSLFTRYSFCFSAWITYTALFTTCAYAEQAAFSIYGKTTSMNQLLEAEQSRFYRIEKEKYNLVSSVAEQAFLDKFWEKEGAKKKIAPANAKELYLSSKVKIDSKEVREVLSKYENHPRLKELSPKDKEQVIRQQLQARGEQEVLQTILQTARQNGTLVVNYPEPEEPVVEFTITKSDPVRYGPEPDQTSPLKGGCAGESCPITLVEISEMECPFCARALPTTKRVMEKYAGKIRWIVRDFPLSHHQRARPAAIAARCAGEQNKFWHMFEMMFENQRSLSDTDITGYAKSLNLDMKNFATCIGSPERYNKMIDANIASATEAGVTGTPAFFINGVLLSGAQPYEEFERIIEKQLKKQTGS